MTEDTRTYNREAWDFQVASGNPWTVPVGAEVIEAARNGEWTVVLIDHMPTPRSWFPESLAGVDLLCLAAGGGQQGPILAAAGARVTVLDNSPAQLAQDRKVADAHGLAVRTVEGDMADLSVFAAESFDLVFHPVSNVFAPDVRPVWREAHRVLRPGGALLAGFMNPAVFVFDWDLAERTGELSVRYPLPFVEERDLPPDQLAARRERGVPVEFSHSLEAQIGGQLEAGFGLVALLEARRSSAEPPDALNPYVPCYIATRAIKQA
ncbi:MAG: class I SAM-dependent methyltransferase [Myxococcota bacterium]